MNVLNQSSQITSSCILGLEDILKNENGSAIILHPSSDNILLANTSACKNLGYTKNQITKVKWDTILSKSFAPIKIQESNSYKTSIELYQLITKIGYSITAEIRKRKVEIDNQVFQLINFKDLSEVDKSSLEELSHFGVSKTLYNKLFAINEKVFCIKQDMFFKNMVYSLANELNARWVMICKEIKSNGPGKAKVLSLWDQTKFQSDIIYDIKGTPCENVYQAKKVYFCRKNLKNLFPEDLLALEWGVESYLGVPILSVKGEVLGQLIAMNDKPIAQKEYLEWKTILEVFALRCSNEIELNMLQEKIKHKTSIRDRLELISQGKNLSSREFEVFEYLSSGLSSKSIAKKLSVTLPTVKFHLKNIYRKLGLKGRKGVLELYAQYAR